MVDSDSKPVPEPRMTVSVTCTTCSVDLSGAKRYRDKKGRAYCADCAKQFATRARPAVREVVPGPVTTVRPAPTIAPPPPILPKIDVHPPRQDAAETGTIELDLGSRRADPEPERRCPECSRPMKADARMCIGCGYDTATGRVAAVEAPIGASREERTKARRAGEPCVNCGYDLKGLPNARCPECGVVNSRFARARIQEKRELRSMYLRPLLGAVIGHAIALAIIGGIHGVPEAAFHAAFYGASIVLVFLTYVGCSLAFIGFDEPLGVTFVRIACVLGVFAPLSLALGFIPGIIGLLVQGVIFAGLLVKIMDIDFDDAKFVVAAIFLVKLAAVITFLWLMR